MESKEHKFCMQNWIDFKVAKNFGTITCRLSSEHNELIK